MRNTLRIMIPLIVLILVSLISFSCSKKAVTATKDPVGGAEQNASTADNTPGYQSEEISETATGTASDGMVIKLNLEDIYFEFDRSTLTAASQDTLMKKARWLKANPETRLVIEGHCDDRGTNEYNLALGDRRAARAKTFLVDLSISPSRLITISYGEERPFVSGSTEEAWEKNRRAHFAVE